MVGYCALITDAVNPGLPPDVDPALWFDTDSCGRHYLADGNPHTFHGRMWAYCPQNDIYTRVSKSEVDRSSREAEYFIRGYLSGDEPDLPRTVNGDPLEEDDQRMVRWRKAVALFRETGYWYDGQRSPCALCGADLLPSEGEPEDGQPCHQCPSPTTAK
jgi:hypothetical protein